MAESLPQRLRRVVRRLAGRAWRGGRYRVRRARGLPAGDFVYRAAPWPECWGQLPQHWPLEVRVDAARIDAGTATAWCQRQRLMELRVVGHTDGAVSYRVDAQGPLEGADRSAVTTPWFYAPGQHLPGDDAQVEACLLLAATSPVDAVTVVSDAVTDEAMPPGEPDADTVAELPWRAFTLFAADAWEYDAATDCVLPRRPRRLVQYLPSHGPASVDTASVDVAAVDVVPGTYPHHSPTRRGAYRSSHALGARLEVTLYDAGQLPRRPPEPDPKRPALLVTTSFLARGGAEHTLFETLRELRDRFDLTLVTLAPHRAELGDRRDDFRQLVPRIFCLGDQVHPASMPGMLSSLVRSTGARTLYNANGTTLFYDFAPGLRAAHPDLRLVDHLYDHRVGYIDRYTPDLLDSVDACVAENRRIRDVLVKDRGWPTERVPVIWPCGRAADAFAPEAQWPELRRQRRHELGIPDDHLLVLTAARMHPQKRPLDLVALAQRLAGQPVTFLVVGGGDLEDDVDAAIAAAPEAPIRRLAFRTDIPDLIVAADVGCLVSDYEGLPVFMLECLQAGRPFLGTAVGDMGEVLRATGAGIVVDQPGDLDHLEASVHRLLDPGTRGDLAQRARDAGHHFDVATCAERYAQAFLGLPVDEPPSAEGLAPPVSGATP